MLDALEGLTRELRAVGIPVSMSEHVDAARSLGLIDLGQRDQVQSALRAALVKSAEHQKAFDVVFDLFFAPRAGTTDDEAAVDGEEAEPRRGRGLGAGGGGIAELDDARLRDLLVDAVQLDDSLTVSRIAVEMVHRHARIEPGRAVAGTFYLLRTMRAINAEGMLAELVARDATPTGPTAGLARRLAIETYEARLDALRQEVESQIRRRLVADRGAEAVARTLREPLPEDIDFLQASQRQIAELREIMPPLVRKLAAQLQVRRRHRRRGALDFRRTVRRSMSTGGVPAEPVFRPSRPAKPQLMVIADISGSVSAFAAFTLQLTYALRTEFAAVRCFIFVDGIDEITAVLAESDDIAAATRRINAVGAGVWLDGHSDYGHALESFWERYGDQIRTRTTVIVLGDARTNYHAPKAEVLAAVRRRASRVFWLNPEPAGAWDSGDSVLSQYARYCDAVFECRNTRQLREFVEQLA